METNSDFKFWLLEHMEYVLPTAIILAMLARGLGRLHAKHLERKRRELDRVLRAPSGPPKL